MPPPGPFRQRVGCRGGNLLIFQGRSGKRNASIFRRHWASAGLSTRIVVFLQEGPAFMTITSFVIPSGLVILSVDFCL